MAYWFFRPVDFLTIPEVNSRAISWLNLPTRDVPEILRNTGLGNILESLGQAEAATLTPSESEFLSLHVDAAIGLHIWNYLPIGKVGIRVGPLMASMDSFKLTIVGREAHGAIPQDAVDAIVVCSQVIGALQTIVSREVSPINPSVVTIGTIRGGKAFNIIADRVEMEGTVRALDPDLHETLPERMERVIRGITTWMRGDYEFQYNFLYPVTINDGAMTQLIQKAAVAVVGKENVVIAEQTMGGEDMAFYLERIPGCYFFVGSANKERALDGPHHNARFNFDEDCLPIGAEIMVRAVLGYLGP